MKKISSALRCLSTVSLIAFTLSSVHSETYTIEFPNLRSDFTKELNAAETTTSIEVTVDGVAWTADFEFTEGNSDNLSPLAFNNYLVVRRGAGHTSIQKVNFKSEFFINKFITDIAVDASFCNASGEGQQTFSIKDGDAIVAPAQTFSVTKGGFLSSPAEVRNFSVGAIIGNCLNLSFSAESGSSFCIKSITINYESEVAPSVERTVNIPVGHKLELLADAEDAEIFYAVGSDNEWVEYNPEVGVAFSTPGNYTLSYYAVANGLRSDVMTEEINVVRASGIHAALAANDEITVSGVVVGNSDDYVLIAADANSENQLALENRDYPGLKTAVIGAKITATGRATDKFGASVRALGSLTNLTVDGTALVPTSMSAPLRQPGTKHVYDLQGRKCDENSKRVIMISEGDKTILL